MRLKLTIIYWLFATIAYGQSKTAIEFFYPDEWFGPIDKSLKWDSISYLGIYEKADTSKQSFQLLDIQLRDTLISEPAYGLLKVLAIDSIKPLFIIAGIDVNNRT